LLCLSKIKPGQPNICKPYLIKRQPVLMAKKLICIAYPSGQMSGDATILSVCVKDFEPPYHLGGHFIMTRLGLVMITFIHEINANRQKIAPQMKVLSSLGNIKLAHLLF
jgi:hypothetical protein